MMDALVIKPTEKCNFKCTFCSSTKIADNPSDILDLDQIYTFLERFPTTRTIIVNGGDPLMMRPEYYWDIIAHIEEKGYPTHISATSNLWPFYKKPERWEALFCHPRFDVMTSFQYGDKRIKGDLTPFTEAEFWAVSDLLLARCGYRPDFISVIDEDNADTILDTVRLAKAMNVECKLNYAMASGPVKQFKGVSYGNEDKLFLLASMYEAYLDVHDAGLGPWEFNTKQLTRRLRGELTICPLSRECDTGIRTLHPSGQYYSCGSFADDDLYQIDFEQEIKGEITTPLQDDPELFSMKASCPSCPLFSICNGCRKTIHDHKRLGLVEQHCYRMKQLAPRLIEANGLTGQMEVTPYVNESNLIAVG